MTKFKVYNYSESFYFPHLPKHTTYWVIYMSRNSENPSTSHHLEGKSKLGNLNVSCQSVCPSALCSKALKSPKSQLVRASQSDLASQLEQASQSQLASHSELASQSQLAIQSQLVRASYQVRATQSELASQSQLDSQSQLNCAC